MCCTMLTLPFAAPRGKTCVDSGWRTAANAIPDYYPSDDAIKAALDAGYHEVRKALDRELEVVDGESN